MFNLHSIKKHPKSTRRKKVVGRGLGSSHGTYSTRGGKGQTARTGHSKMPAGFEGGRQPLVRQLPKTRGFRSLAKLVIALDAKKLNSLNDGEVVTLAVLKVRGLVHKRTEAVKIVGQGVTKKLKVRVPVTSKAKEAIIKVGGSVK